MVSVANRQSKKMHGYFWGGSQILGEVEVCKEAANIVRGHDRNFENRCKGHVIYFCQYDDVSWRCMQ